MQVDFPSTDEDLKLTSMIARFQAKDPEDELMVPALRAVYPEKKILVPESEPDQGSCDSHQMTLAKQWLERQSIALPDWQAPNLQSAQMMPGPSR